MKRGILVISIVLAAGIYYLYSIDSPLQLSFQTSFPITATQRKITDLKTWKAWWPGKEIADSTYALEDQKLRVQHFTATSFELRETSTQILTTVSFIPYINSGTQFVLKGYYPLAQNPFKRLAQLSDYLKWKKEIKTLALKMHDHFTNVENLYRFNIQMKKVLNSPHISMTAEFDHQPSWHEVYSLLDQIRTYTRSIRHNVVDSPILNMYTEAGKQKVMVAYATDTILPSSGPFHLKQMVLGNILIAEVKGGQSRIDSCQEQILQYVEDYGKTSPAISYQRLITDRRKVSDSSKWITTVNFPVFE